MSSTPDQGNDIPQGWTSAYSTYYESYPSTQEEGDTYNGFQWEGQFAFVDGKKSENWVASQKIASVYEAFGEEYANQFLDIAYHDDDTDGWRILSNVQVLDIAANSDCNGCPTSPGELVEDHGFLLDLEIHTMKRLTGGELHTGEVFYRLAEDPSGADANDLTWQPEDYLNA